MSATGNGFGRLGVAPEPLCDLVTALSPYGLPLQFLDRALHLIRRNATLHALARRLTRRPTDEPGGGVIPAVPSRSSGKSSRYSKLWLRRHSRRKIWEKVTIPNGFR